MDRLELREGSLVEEGELLTTLSDNSTMWVYFNVPEAEYLDYATDPLGIENRPVTLLMANGRQFAEPGHIAVIEADFNNRTGTIPFRADFANPTGLLRHGQTGKILLAKPIPGALLVPQKATFEILDQTYVYVLREGGQVQQRRIVMPTSWKTSSWWPKGWRAMNTSFSRACAMCVTARWSSTNSRIPTAPSLTSKPTRNRRPTPCLDASSTARRWPSCCR
jgi:hypothetical protein